jgi:outer membrane protein assembly factor BamA
MCAQLQARVSVGCGLAASLGSVRLELDYSVPLRKGGSDVEQRWQFGLAGSIFS